MKKKQQSRQWKLKTGIAEVTKEPRTAQPALPVSVTERLPEPMEVERNGTMLVDDSMTLEEFRQGVVQGSTPTEAGVSQEPKKQKVEPTKQAPTSSGSVLHPPLFAGRISREVEDFHMTLTLTLKQMMNMKS